VMFFSMHTLIAAAALAHSRIFAGEVAGVVEELGRVNPIASMEVDMALVYEVSRFLGSSHRTLLTICRVHSSAGTGSRASVPLDILHNLVWRELAI
jgi:hypothetical protein